jgi:TonB family protein
MRFVQFWDLLVPVERRPLGFLIALSLAGHIACFFLFVTPTPPLLRAPRPPLTVSLAPLAPADPESPPTAERPALLDILDPRVLAIPQSPLPEPEALHALNHDRPGPGAAPGSEKRPQALDRLPVPRQGLSSLSDRLGTMNRLFMPAPAAVVVETPPALSGTAWQIDGALAGRAVVKKPELGRPEVRDPLKATVLQIVANPNGLVEAGFVEESCGDSAIDQAGLHALRGMRFAPLPPGNTKTQTGRVTLFWDFAEKAAADAGGAAP